MDFFLEDKITTNQLINPFSGFEIKIKREDKIHPIVSGNKFRKLKYNLASIKSQNKQPIISFGGAFSNHLAALAASGKMVGIPTIGIVRGEEWQNKITDSSTLTFCQSQGMQLIAISRANFRFKEQAKEVQEIQNKFPHFIFLPEGGTNSLAVKGCQEILSKNDQDFDVICVCVGTGGTLAGLIEGSAENQQLLGFMSVKDTSLETKIAQFTNKKNWQLIEEYTFGGYAKITPKLIVFINSFYQQYGIPLDPIYTGKMLFGIFDLIEQNKWQWGQKILIIHSGGLQGIAGINYQLRKKGQPELLFSEV